MSAQLLSNNSYSTMVANVAAAICVGKEDNALDQLQTSKVYPDADYNTVNLSAAIASGHYSILEHIYFTFLIENISRSCSHQLVRHRHFSYSQQSQRYCKLGTEAEWYIEPNSIFHHSLKEIGKIPEKDGDWYNFDKYSTLIGTDTLHNRYMRLMDDTVDLYNLMCDEGIPMEDARFVLPNACKTSLIVSMNARAFIEACTLRLCNKAQWEIKKLFEDMKECLRYENSIVFNLCKPNCQKSIGCQESKPCNREK
jgi:thymidylate synthase, flavin-dependent